MELIHAHNVRLLLQGYLHFPEDIHVLNRTRFITGGAIAGRALGGVWVTVPADLCILRLTGKLHLSIRAIQRIGLAKSDAKNLSVIGDIQRSLVGCQGHV